MGPHDFSGSVGPFFVLETGQRDGWRRSEMTETLTRTRIRALRPADWQQVARIYEEGMLTGNATFETSVPSWEEWDAGHLAGQRLVVTLRGDVAGLLFDRVDHGLDPLADHHNFHLRHAFISDRRSSRTTSRQTAFMRPSRSRTPTIRKPREQCRAMLASFSGKIPA
jgi:hypothetical protein